MSDFRSSICRRSGSRFGCFKVSNGNKAIVESRCTPWWRSWRGPRLAWSQGWSSPWTSASWRRLWRSQRLNWDHVAFIVIWISGSLKTCEQRPLQDRGVQAVEGEILWIGLRVLGVRRLLLAGSQGGRQAAVEGGQELWVFRWGKLSVTRTRTRRTRAALYDRWPFRPTLAWHFILGPYLTTFCEFLGFLLLPKA